MTRPHNHSLPNTLKPIHKHGEKNTKSDTNDLILKYTQKDIKTNSHTHSHPPPTFTSTYKHTAKQELPDTDIYKIKHTLHGKTHISTHKDTNNYRHTYKHIQTHLYKMKNLYIYKNKLKHLNSYIYKFASRQTHKYIHNYTNTHIRTCR